MITYLVTLCDSSQFEIRGWGWLSIAEEIEIIRHRDYGSLPIFSVVSI